MNRMEELHDEDLLGMSVGLRQKLKLPIEPAAMDKWEGIVMNRKVKIREKNPTVPIIHNEENVEVTIPNSPVQSHKSPAKMLIDLEELSLGMNLTKSTTEVVIKPLAAGSSNNNNADVQDAQPEPPLSIKPEPKALKTLTNQDLIILFGNYSSLGDELKTELNDYMKSIELNDPIRYRDLMNTKVDTADGEDSKQENNSINETGGYSDLDSISQGDSVNDSATQNKTLVIADATESLVEVKPKIEIKQIEIIKIPAAADDDSDDSESDGNDSDKTVVNDEDCVGLSKTFVDIGVDIGTNIKSSSGLQPLPAELARQIHEMPFTSSDGAQQLYKKFTATQTIPEPSTSEAITKIDDEDEDDYDLNKSDLLQCVQDNVVIIELSDNDDVAEVVLIDLTADRDDQL